MKYFAPNLRIKMGELRGCWEQREIEGVITAYNY
jgi:hypothetical protein